MSTIEHIGEPVIEHPNREGSGPHTMRAIVVILLLASALLIAVVTFGGWSVLMGMKAVCIAWILLYLACAWYVVKWNRGLLPVIAALATMMGAFAVVAVPAWTDRNAPGLTQPAIDSGVLGTLTALLVPVQILLIAAAMYAFNQKWNVEVEHWPEEEGRLPAGA